MKNTKKAFLYSVLSLLLCCSMLLGTTFAWFTDSVESGANRIVAGNLDVELEYLNANGQWKTVREDTNVFAEDILWEPGHTEVVYLKLSNLGNLALKYQLGVNIASEKLSVNVYNEPLKLSDHIQLGVESDRDGKTNPWASRADAISAVSGSAKKLNTGYTGTGKLYPKDNCPVDGKTEQYVALVVYMPESVGNEANHKKGVEAPEIHLGITLVATQQSAESDSFGPNYDDQSKFPTLKPGSVSQEVQTNGGLTTQPATIQGDGISADVPANVKVDGNVLTLSVSEMQGSNANISLQANELLRSLDVHMAGVSADNTVPMLITVEQAMMIGLNIGSYTLYHVENGVPVAMTSVASLADLDVHNEFYYDPATGNVVLCMATFSEVALVADTENAWEGNYDYSWYTNAVAPIDGESVTEYTIANADQLAAFGAIVGGMNGQTRDSFKDKTVKLLADINLGDKNNANESLIFHPIGYYYTDDKNTDGTKGDYYSTVNSFEGTFDGNGHTIANFYQNTWEIKGDYDGSYYKDAMGLFGYVVNGKVMNLTVDNFSSDGEYTPTGVIAAYAVHSTFENIAITNCNPRVYNTGNGGIIGIAGRENEAVEAITLKNITVDNSNKISALWGSWDVACGGLVGMYRGNVDGNGNATGDTIFFENCHVAARIDVYNDVCANYQYYAYRYAGMIIGSVRHNTTNKEGKTIPNMTGITASGCTVHFGTWNDYYYCELVDNTTASYTHDYQMSRLVEIKEINGTTITYLDGKTGTVPTSGSANYVIVDYTKGHGTANATCYHFKNGEVWTHDKGGIQTGIDENGDGKDDLREDKQHLYLEFSNLFTGYGWGVSSMGIDKWNGIEKLDVTTGDHEKSVEKFKSEVTELVNNKEYTLGDIFELINNVNVEIVPGSLTVTVTNLDESNPVSAKFKRDTANWEDGTITLKGAGKVTITIQDYYFCTPTTITVDVVDRQPEEKFDVVMKNGDFLHRVGNSGTVALDKLFKAKSGIDVGTISVTVDAVNGTDASGTYSNKAIQFKGTGVVKVTIKDDDEYCTPTVLYLEVVDAVNATVATDATSNNVVLLNNIGSGFTVDNGHTVYGNGFTLTYTGDGRYLNNGLKQGVVMVQNGGTLDNLSIKASVYPTAFMYYGATQVGDYVQQDSNPREVEGTKTRYYYQLSAVATYGDATISNCYIYGGRNNIYVNTGNVTIKDSVLECGVVSNVQIQSNSAYTVTLEDVTTIQHQVNATIGDTSKVMLGAGILVGPDTTENPTIVLDGDFKQYNWVTEDDKNAVSGTMAQKIIQGALDATAYNHTINGKKASNLGIIYMNEEKVDIVDNTKLPYKEGTVTMSGNINGQVYSLQNATGDQIYSDCVNADRSTVNGDYLPTFDFDLGNQEISYDGSEDNRYLYGDINGVTALYQDGDAALTLDLSKLAVIYKYAGLNYPYTAVCKNASGQALTASNNVITLNAQGDYTLVFTVQDNIFYDKDGNAIDKSVTRTFSVPLKLTVKEANVKNAVVNITKTNLDGVYTTVNLTDYKLRINFLDAIFVTDYDNKGNGTTVSLSSNIASATLTPASVNVFTTAYTITVTYTDGRVLTVNLSKISGSSPGTKTATVNTSGGLYFITDGALNNKPTASADQNKCTITSVSFKGNSGSTVTNDTDVTVTWALGSSSGCFAEGTLITLANGTKKPIEQITYEDQLLAWDFNTGAYVSTTASLIESHEAGEYRVINLKFADGTIARVIVDHGFFDVEENNFVYIDEDNVASYVGHEFVKVGNDGTYESVELTGYEVTVETVSYYTIQTAIYNNCIAENMFTLTSPPEMLDNDEWFDYFEIGDNMKYDEAKMQADIEKYGLYTYEDFVDYVTYEQFIAFNGPYLKVLVGRGVVTWEQIIELIATYVN